MTMIPEAPPAMSANAPVTGLMPGCRRSTSPASRLSSSVPTVTSRTGSQLAATARSVPRSTSAPMDTPTTAWAAVIAGGGTAMRRRNASARTSPASRPPNSAGEGIPRTANRTAAAAAAATTAHAVEELPAPVAHPLPRVRRRHLSWAVVRRRSNDAAAGAESLRFPSAGVPEKS